MKTEDLVTLLATGLESVDHRKRLLQRWVVTGAGILVAFVLSASVLKVNAHLGLEIADPLFWIRSGLCLSVAATAFVAVDRLGLPGRRLGVLPVVILIAPTIVWILALVSLMEAPASHRLPLIVGHTARVCPFLIAFLSVAPLAGIIGGLRGLAPTRLRWSGAAAGLAAGGFGALAYTLHCPELQPAFFGIWYVLGMLIPAVLGAALGPRLLRW